MFVYVRVYMNIYMYTSYQRIEKGQEDMGELGFKKIYRRRGGGGLKIVRDSE